MPQKSSSLNINEHWSSLWRQRDQVPQINATLSSLKYYKDIHYRKTE